MPSITNPVQLSLLDGKICPDCKEWKPFTKFLKGGYAGGRSPRCRNCTVSIEARRRHDKEKYARHAEKVKARVKRYTQDNAEIVKERRAASYQKRKRNSPPTTKAWRVINPEFVKAHSKVRDKVYERRKPEIRQAIKIRRRALEVGAIGGFTAIEWRDLCNQFGNTCLRCHQKKPLSVDHIVPLSMGGSNFISNIQPLCVSCNSIKGKRTIDYRHG